MTFPCKEEFILFERLDKRQHQIYDDAADVGLEMDEFDVKTAREALKSMMEVYEYKAAKDHCKSYEVKTVEISIPVEINGLVPIGYILHVCFTNDFVRNKKYITITIIHGAV